MIRWSLLLRSLRFHLRRFVGLIIQPRTLWSQIRPWSYLLLMVLSILLKMVILPNLWQKSIKRVLNASFCIMTLMMVRSCLLALGLCCLEVSFQRMNDLVMSLREAGRTEIDTLRHHLLLRVRVEAGWLLLSVTDMRPVTVHGMHTSVVCSLVVRLVVSGVMLILGLQVLVPLDS